jgi:hypothetical protein
MATEYSGLPARLPGLSERALTLHRAFRRHDPSQPEQLLTDERACDRGLIDRPTQIKIMKSDLRLSSDPQAAAGADEVSLQRNGRHILVD